jgi:parallel beta-helix repeat protein
MRDTDRDTRNRGESSEVNEPSGVSRRGFIQAAIVASSGALAAAVGCGDDDTSDTVPGGDAGKGTGGGAGASGDGGGAGFGGSGKAGSAGKAGSSGAAGASGHAGAGGHAGAAGGSGASGHAGAGGHAGAAGGSGAAGQPGCGGTTSSVGYDLDLSTLSWADDGVTDEGAKLQAALYSLGDGTSGTRKRVLFPCGKTIMINQQVNTRLWTEYNGNGSTIKLVANSSIDHEDGFFRIYNGCHVHHLKFDGQMYEQSTAYGTNDMGFPSSTNGVFLYSDCIFEYNEVSNVGAYSLTTYLMNNITIQNNTIHDTWQYGIALKGESDTGTGAFGYCTNITVTGNTLYNCYQEGIKIAGATDSLISGNTVTIPTPMAHNSDTPDGIKYYSLDCPNADVTVTGNTIVGNSASSHGISSDENHFTANDNPRSVVTDNIISKCGVGIKASFNDGTITGNKISNCGTCIVDDGTGNTVTNNPCT